MSQDDYGKEDINNLNNELKKSGQLLKKNVKDQMASG